MTVWLATFAIFLGSSGAHAQFRERDPLTQKEAEDLADAKQEPEKRLNLLVVYARARLTSIEQLKADAKAQDRGQKLHDLLEDFTTIMDELSDNLDEYAEKKDDIRKPLKKVIEGDTEFQIRLKNFKQAGTGASESSEYTFVLQNAVESVASNADDARKILDEQERIVQAAKEAEKQKKKH